MNNFTNNLTMGSIVVGRIDQVSEAGMFIGLVEHRDRVGFVPVAEMSQRKRTSVNKHSPIGSICVFRVLVVTDKGVDLSRKNIDAAQASTVLGIYLASCSPPMKASPVAVY